MHLPWKRWVEFTVKEELCIIGWIDRIIPSGPDFDIKKLGASDLREVAGPYVDSILNGNDKDCEVFSVVRWSPGVWFICHYDNIVLMFPQSSTLFPTIVTSCGVFGNSLIGVCPQRRGDLDLFI